MANEHYGLSFNMIHFLRRYAQKKIVCFRSQWPWPFDILTTKFLTGYSCPVSMALISSKSKTRE